MYYIILKKKEGTYLLDKSQSVLWKDKDLGMILSTWTDIKQHHNANGNLYLVHADSDTPEKQFLTVVRQF